MYPVDETEESFATQRSVRLPYITSVSEKFQSLGKKLKSLWKSETSASQLTFHIYALGKVTVAEVKRSLQTKVNELANTSEIRDDAVASLTALDEQNIAQLRSTGVGIEIGLFTFSSTGITRRGSAKHSDSDSYLACGGVCF